KPLFFYLPLKCLLVLQLKLSGLFLFFSQQNDVGPLLNRARILNHFYLVVCYSLLLLLIFFSLAHNVDFLLVLFPLNVRLLPCTFFILLVISIIDLLHILLTILLDTLLFDLVKAYYFSSIEVLRPCQDIHWQYPIQFAALHEYSAYIDQ